MSALSDLPARCRRTPWWGGAFRVGHIAVYRATGGFLGHWLWSQRALLLTTTGRKTGLPRTQPLSYFAFEGPTGPLTLVASNWGNDAPPAWYLNLLAQPRAQVQLKRETFTAQAYIVTGEERARLWPQVVRGNDMYAGYQKATAREIPIVQLHRVH
jgi:deazaflavin-dependent oxidoreductase (nitroreductase family)